MKQSIYNAALYLRLSRDDEGAGESNSIATQCMMLRRYAEQNHLFVVDEYIDDGYSGTNFNRPNFQRMMGDIEAGRVNCVVVKDDCEIIRLNGKPLAGQGLDRFLSNTRCFLIKPLQFKIAGAFIFCLIILPERYTLHNTHANGLL